MSHNKLIVLILSLSCLVWPYSVKAKSFADISAAMDFYHTLESAGEWPQIPPGPSLRVNDIHPHIPLIRQQLKLLGDIEANSLLIENPELLGNPELFDHALFQALSDFQSRHGAEADGILGRHSRRLLNISPAERAQQIIVNMARQQRFGTPAAPHYIRVNIPEFKLRLYQQGLVTLDMKTIIGRKKRQTPVFDTLINTLVVNPSWNVPKSIAFKDILPKWALDTSYLSKHNLQIRAGWGPNSRVIPADQVDPASLYQGANYLRLYEPPSERNTLGQFKFLSQSQYAIYLHDTPAKQLFSHTRRDFSSGCIRLEKAQDLADALLTLANRPEQGQLDRLIQTDDTLNIPLREPIPLYVVYWTAWLDDNGKINFRDDIYQRDMSDLAKFKSEENQLSAVD
ncbi:L,D-transpeptidase family protein [Neptunomonas qingdaonensis]|uniref:L,D-transpeptidase catalytic domain n=1 Tax=Neptunomonas qingdaonensis TaxID=1045558 RepID=A0A1I2QCF5_9GAMM|nr:L,D-transpeptidase family protein [Neptunomonas qingdaonensis]SFG23456.1 L,D-transpeptidase catalytic domain [Neptunomonas qingdaonensis]